LAFISKEYTLVYSAMYYYKSNLAKFQLINLANLGIFTEYFEYNFSENCMGILPVLGGF
jgi:hypothetical protein